MIFILTSSSGMQGTRAIILLQRTILTIATLSSLLVKHKCRTMTKLFGLGLSSLKSVDFMDPGYASFACTVAPPEGQPTSTLAALSGSSVFKSAYL